MPGLRVRIIDKKYQSGRYYKSKVKIEDVVSIDSCICCTDEGKLLYDVNPDRLETIVPKTDKANVMLDFIWILETISPKNRTKSWFCPTFRNP
ncbi:Uncharacterised protein r2_g3164 [Pycnogonum litorale]